MLKYLRRFLGLHDHIWEEVDRGNLITSGSGKYVGKYWTYQCQVCKEIKEVSS